MKKNTKILLALIVIILAVITGALFIVKSSADNKPDCSVSTIEKPNVYSC